MMGNHKRMIIVAVFIVAAVVQVLIGVLAGARHDWPRMSFIFSLFGVFVLGTTIGIVRARILSYLTELEEGFPTDHVVVYRSSRSAENLLSIVALLSLVVYSALSMLAISRQEYLRLGLYLTTCGVTYVVCAGVTLMLEIRCRLTRLKKLISEHDEVRAAQDRPRSQIPGTSMSKPSSSLP